MTLSGAARIAGVAGYPIAHSLSPLMHNYWLKVYDIDGAYVPLKIAPEDFVSAMQGLRKAGFRGLNVTVPHKEMAFTYATQKGPAAYQARAANLLVFEDHKVRGENTDHPGLIAALNEAMGPGTLRGKAVVIWGAGGMARAAACALAEMGVDKVHILSRRPEQSAMLAETLSGSAEIKIIPGSFEDWPVAGAEAALLVNATSAGMGGRAPIDLPLEALAANAAVFDAVYNPLLTPLLAAAKSQNRLIIDGLGLLIHQAVPSFEAFFGVKPAVTAELRQILEVALHG